MFSGDGTQKIQSKMVTIDDVFEVARDFNKTFILDSFELDIEKGHDVTVAFRIA